MLNYMKSEGYRILHSRGMYLFTGITAAAVFFSELAAFLPGADSLCNGTFFVGGC